LQLIIKQEISQQQVMELSTIQGKIHEIRGYKVMLDFDLAEIYQVETKNLKRAVRRNKDRFPPDFMFELTQNEWDFLRCNFGASNYNQEKRGGIRYLPFVFTEQGVAQLSSILNSQFAIQMNISIIRAFVLLRQYALGYTELNRKLEDFMIETNMQFNDIYQVLTAIAEQKKKTDTPLTPIGFTAPQYREKDK
jgi:hypothetical protein